MTSPPYWGLRDYGEADQLGLEATPEAYVEKLVGVFREVRRVLRDDGTLWLNLGDSYARDAAKGQHRPGDSGKQAYIYDRGNGRASATADMEACGLKPKDLVGIPWRVAFALQADGWYLRSDIIWAKPNPMPESVTDRPTKAHEYLFLLTKSARYYYDAAAIKEPGTGRAPGNKGPHKYAEAYESSESEHHRTAAGLEKVRSGYEWRNARSVWTITSQPFPGAHFAVMPPKLVEPCIKAGCPAGGTVLDPFLGAGTVAYVARDLGSKAVGIELSADYCEIAAKRLGQEVFDFG